ncbi:MAG: ATP-binding protein [Candidatus Methylomirabilales bacterium]
MKQRNVASAFLPSPLRLFLTVLAVMFIAEAAVMFLLPVLLPGAHGLVEAIADTSILTVLSTLFLWWFVVRPLRGVALAEHMRTATIVRYVADGIITINEQGLVESFNPAAERIFGYREEDVVGQPLSLLMPERYRDAHRRGLERVRSTGRSHLIGKKVELHGLRRDGSEFPLELSLALWKREKGTFYTGIIRDITERKRAEETRQALYRLSGLLRQSLNLEEVYPAFAEAVKTHLPYDRIGVVVPEGERLVTALSAAEPPLPSYQGMSWPQKGKTAVEWVLAHKIPRLIRDLATEQAFQDEAFIAQEGIRATLYVPLLAGGEAVGVFFLDSRTPGAYTERDLELLEPLAEQIAFALQNARLYEELRQAALQLEAKVEERTRELKIANLRLEAASRHKSEFLASMSHELRTPLNSIIGFSEVLRDQLFGPLTEKQARYVQNILVSGRHLLALINDLLDLSKVEAGRIELHLEQLPLREALEGALNLVRGEALKKGLTLELAVAQDLSTLPADPIRFKQILSNLLSNAVKFTPEGGTVRITAHRVTSEGQDAGRWPLATCGDFVEIAVTDTGIGIKPEDQGRLFQEFVQLDSPLAKGHEGTGLGLALTKRLVELHGGRIWVESEGEGKGSRFAFLLPLKAPGKKRILVAEDDEAVQNAVRESLQRSGFEVELARDGEEALAQVERKMPDLLILDIGLPKLDGLSVLKRLRDLEKVRGWPILVLSATDVDQAEEALSLGADEFLTKPFSTSVLLDTVRRLLARAGKQKS